MDLCCCSYSYNTSFDDLPDGLVVDILSRLPVKTLVQSTCVCKLWFSIIKSPSFISTHLSHSISDLSSHYIFLSNHHSPSLTVISDNPLLTHHQDFKFPFETNSTYIKLIGACNGLICVTDSYLVQSKRGREIYLTNPFTHKYKRLDTEYSCYADINVGVSGIVLNIGFGYSEVDDDYKVLRIITQFAVTRECPFVYKAEIYSLKSGKWKAVDVSIEIEVAPLTPPVFMNGCLYWQAQDRLPSDEYCLLCFDLKDELFSRIELPKTNFPLCWTWRRNVFVKDGSLTIVLFTSTDVLESVLRPCMRICLLVLEKKSGEQVHRWKEFNYECANFNPSHCIGFGAMGLCGGGGRLMFVSRSNLQPEYVEYIVTVDLDNSCAIERLALDFGTNINGAANVSESLVLLSD